jgi:hypothetical protein
MLYIEDFSWINGITASFSFIFACVLGVSVILQARKIEAKLLFYMGLNILFAGFFWFGVFLDFFSLLIMGVNIMIPPEALAIIYFVWSPIAFLFSFYIAAELFSPNKKLFITIPFLILGSIYEIFLFMFPLENVVVDNISPGEMIIEVTIDPFKPAGLINYTFVLIAFIFCGFGFLYKGIKSKEIIRRKLLSLSTGYIFFSGAPIFVFVLQMREPYTYIARMVMIMGFVFFYLGLKETDVEKMQRREIKKELQLKESLFRFYERPEHITEEEISYYKEKKICLVCKGDVARLNYICPKCSTLYCTNCSEQLSELENMCWVCNEPFDEAKPVKPYERKKPPDEDRGKN